jgi:RimJ/RimL family protein N-acetyltransferase
VTLPRLATGRLRLEPVTLDHLPLLEQLNADAEVMRFILGRAATAAETRAEWVRRLDDQSDPGRGLGYWAGFADGRFAGWWSASSFQTDRGVAGLGYRLARDAWGRGLATEGARRMVDQAFACADVGRVVASTMAVNLRSRAVLEKAGFFQTRAWVQQWDDPVEGWQQGEVEYTISRRQAGGAGVSRST